MNKLGRFLRRLGRVAPQILALTPLAPIAPAVAAAMAEAEQIAGATGRDKLAHVVAVATRAAEVAQLSGVPIDPADVQAAAGDVIGAIVAVAKVAHPPTA